MLSWIGCLHPIIEHWVLFEEIEDGHSSVYGHRSICEVEIEELLVNRKGVGGIYNNLKENIGIVFQIL